MSYANHAWTGYVYMLLVLRSMQSIVAQKDSCYWIFLLVLSRVVFKDKKGGCNV
mgnify:CR=1 FL=1